MEVFLATCRDDLVVEDINDYLPAFVVRQHFLADPPNPSDIKFNEHLELQIAEANTFPRRILVFQENRLEKPTGRHPKSWVDVQELFGVNKRIGNPENPGLR